MSNQCYNIKETEMTKTKTKLLYISSAKYQSDWQSIVHSHHFTELFYVLKGEGNFIVEDKTFSVKEDDLVIVNPNIEHTEVSKGSSPLEYIVLAIEGLSFSSHLTELGNNYNLYNYKDYKNEVLFYLTTLASEIKNKESNYEVVCQNLLEVLLINIVRRTDYALSIEPSKMMNKECAFIKRYIDENFKKNITLDLLAELTHMNKYYLVHTFKKSMGISPINYLIERRIEESQILLATTYLSIGEIASILGFSSQSYFSQSFKRTTGETPNGYRKSILTEPIEPVEP